MSRLKAPAPSARGAFRVFFASPRGPVRPMEKNIFRKELKNRIYRTILRIWTN